MNKRAVTTAVILAAGVGSRRLPITRVIEKAMLPVGNRPAIDYVVEQCVDAGIERIIFIVNTPGGQIQKYYGDQIRSTDEYPWLKSSTITQTAYCVQPPSSYGTGAALLAAKGYVDRDESFVVLAADGFLHDPKKNYVKELITEHAITSSDAVLVGLTLPAHRAAKYAVISHESGKMSHMVEKPSDLDADLNYYAHITYLLAPYTIFDKIEQVKPDNGEIYLTTAINQLAEKHHVQIVIADTLYFDTGEKQPWLQANNHLSDPEY